MAKTEAGRGTKRKWDDEEETTEDRSGMDSQERT